MYPIICKSLILWMFIIPLAILNGALREYLLIPLIGAAGYPISGIILCIFAFFMTSVFIPRLGQGNRNTYVKMGVVWIICTVIFETLLGILSGDSLSVVLNNYNILTGNLWLLVVLFLGFTPWLAAKRRKLI